jgi:hypothetical protein
MMTGKNSRPLANDEDWYSLATLRPSSLPDWKSVYPLFVRGFLLMILHIALSKDIHSSLQHLLE